VAKFMSDGVGNPARESAPAGYRWILAPHR